MHSGIVRARQLTVFLFFLLSLSVLLVRLAYLQACKHSFYSEIASEQHVVSIEIPPKRGTIFDRNRRVLAVNLNSDSIYANARAMSEDEKKSAAVALAPILHIDESFILKRLARNKAFIWIRRKVTPDEASAIKKLKIDGIGVIKESKRFYPNRDLACHVIGTVDIDNNGLEGLELQFNKYLKGEPGYLITTRDAKRKLVESYQDEFVPPKDGFGLVLTIDEVIQHIAERELQKMYMKYNARGASIVVMDPATGDILALANFPNYDLNDLGGRQPESIRNRAINDFYEPGSVFKAITASALLDTKSIDLTDTVYCEHGEWPIRGRILHDVHPYGELTFMDVIGKSSNIGTVKAASLLGPARMYEYMRAFGLYEKTGIDLPGEVVGMNRPVSDWSKVSMYAIPMGQEVTVTALQLACAIAVISNNGYLVRPRIVREIIDEKGETVKEFDHAVRRRVIAPETVAKMRAVLQNVVENGTGKKAKLQECTAGGKTGTAQKIEANGTYSHSKFIGSFIGFAPVDRPRLAVVVSIDEAHPVYYGGDVAAPVFRNVVDESLKYLHVKSVGSTL